jgi:hypothetical protein
MWMRSPWARWLNDGAKGYLNGVLPGEVLLDHPALLIRALAPQQLLAMKLSAWRDDVDIADARILLREFPGQREEVWNLIEPFLVPGRELKAKLGAFLELLDDHEGVLLHRASQAASRSLRPNDFRSVATHPKTLR